MILSCNSCQKSFIVPDNAITSKGRLVQCSSCGNKWTQYPIEPPEIKITIENKKSKIINNEKIPKIKSVKKKSKKRKTPNLYSPDYLQKKHGINLINPSSEGLYKGKIEKKGIKISKNNLGFYSYLIILIVFLTTFYASLNLTQDLIIDRFPQTENFINYLFETINNFKIIIIDLINRY
jgi:predicted Zn finger-like uncharacterized protein|tara:strand:+ start:126 stop:662 length:537 start_codon:yes stop_codon:yes gene_type:complete